MSNLKQDLGLVSGSVASVNGQIGNVTLDGDNIDVNYNGETNSINKNLKNIATELESKMPNANSLEEIDSSVLSDSDTTPIAQTSSKLNKKISFLSLFNWIKNKFITSIETNVLTVNNNALLGMVEHSVKKLYSPTTFSANSSFQIGGGASNINGMTPDGIYVTTGSSGKWYQRSDSSWAVQINAGTSFYIPVVIDGEITVSYYNQGTKKYTVTENSLTSVKGYTGNYYKIDCNTNDYIGYISYEHTKDFGLKLTGMDVNVLGQLSANSIDTNSINAYSIKSSSIKINGSDVFTKANFSFDSSTGVLNITL